MSTIAEKRESLRKAAADVETWQKNRRGLIAQRNNTKARAASDPMARALLDGLTQILEADDLTGEQLERSVKMAAADLERWQEARRELLDQLAKRKAAMGTSLLHLEKLREALRLVRAAESDGVALQTGVHPSGAIFTEPVSPKLSALIQQLEQQERWIREAERDLAPGGRYGEPLD